MEINKTEITSKIIELLKLGVEGLDAKVTDSNVHGEKNECITIDYNNGSMSVPIEFLIESLEEEADNGMELLDVAYEIFSKIRELNDAHASFNDTSCDEIKENVGLMVVATGDIESHLSESVEGGNFLSFDIPEFKDFGNRKLYAVPYYVNEDDYIAVFDEGILEEMQLTKDELYKVAVENIKNGKVQFEVPGESLEFDFELTACEAVEKYNSGETDLILLRSAMFDGRFGASVILLKDVFKYISEQLDDDLYVLPTSKSEIGVCGIHSCNRDAKEVREYMEHVYKNFSFNTRLLDDFIVFTKDGEWL